VRSGRAGAASDSKTERNLDPRSKRARRALTMFARIPARIQASVSQTSPDSFKMFGGFRSGQTRLVMFVDRSVRSARKANRIDI